jgi:hypothetical protein
MISSRFRFGCLDESWVTVAETNPEVERSKTVNSTNAWVNFPRDIFGILNKSTVNAPKKGNKKPKALAELIAADAKEARNKSAIPAIILIYDVFSIALLALLENHPILNRWESRWV